MTHPTPKDYEQQEKTPQQIERDTKTIVDSYTPNEWREEVERFEERWLGCLDNLGKAPNDTHTDFKRDLQTLLDQHSARLVARFSEEIAIHKEIMRTHEGEIFPKSWHEGKIEAFNQAIDIVKDNK